MFAKRLGCLLPPCIERLDRSDKLLALLVEQLGPCACGRRGETARRWDGGCMVVWWGGKVETRMGRCRDNRGCKGSAEGYR